MERPAGIKVDALLTTARNAEKRGEYAIAQRAYLTVLERFPGNLRARKGLRELDAALAPTYQALTPAYPALAPLLALFEEGNYPAARDLAERLLEQFPQSFYVWSLYGSILLALDDATAAEEAYLRSLELKPDYADTHFNIARAYRTLENRDAAITFLLRALALDPDHAKAHHDIGWQWHGLRRIADAIASLTRATELDPANPVAFESLGDALVDDRQFEKAITAYRTALAIEPGRERAQTYLLATQAHVCDWSGWPAQADMATLGMKEGADALFALIGIDHDPARTLARAQTMVARKHTRKSDYTAPAAPATPRRLRIGYFSADFEKHAVMYLMAGLLREHDRSRFELIAYSFGSKRVDEMREHVIASCDAFHDILELGDDAAVEFARSHELDVAVDCNGFTRNARTELFARRVAPLQINYLGYPGTMGAPFMDYIVGDALVTPPEWRDHYAERLIRMPGSYQPNDNQRPVIVPPGGRNAHGLPEDGFVFCCFNAAKKITPVEFDIWMRLLCEVPGSVLWLFASNRWIDARLRAEAAQRGVDPARLVFAPFMAHHEHLGRQRHADLFLDTFVYNAHTTASDALWGGLPLVTMAGKTFQARVAASLLTAAGLPELITHTPEAYAALALELARTPARLAELRAKLAANLPTCPLFDTAGYARALESAYTAIVERYRAGLPPADILL